MSVTSSVRKASAFAASIVLAALAAGTAAAAPPIDQVNRPMVSRDVAAATSSNWAGYAVTGSTAVTSAFTRVFAAWPQPKATCVPGQPTYSAFWVGLGGFNAGSQALEQVGTEADCSVTGQASYAVWYELVPAAPVSVKLAIKPGDSVVASVAVSGRNVTVKISNYTRKKSFTKKLTMKSPDLSSAEWIAEAPSTCTGGACLPLPLANFGTVTFVSASATAAGHTGTISDLAWAANAISLDEGGAVAQGRFGAAAPNAAATPAALSSDGSSFGVSWSTS
jgi:Peptidase A4 family